MNQQKMLVNREICNWKPRVTWFVRGFFVSRALVMCDGSPMAIGNRLSLSSPRMASNGHTRSCGGQWTDSWEGCAPRGEAGNGCTGQDGGEHVCCAWHAGLSKAWKTWGVSGGMGARACVARGHALGWQTRLYDVVPIGAKACVFRGSNFLEMPLCMACCTV